MHKKTQNHAARLLIKAVPDAIDYFRKILIQTDQKKAEQKAEKYCTAQFHTVHGEEISRLKAEIPEDTQRIKQRKKEIAAQEQLIAKTDRMIRVTDKLKREVPDQHDRNVRKGLDILLGITCLFAAVLVLAMGASNVFSIIMASGTPIFLEQPELAWMLSGLMPLGAFALEFFKRHLQSNEAQRVYTISIFGLAAFLLLDWVVLFALLFGSPGDTALDIDALLKPAGEDYLGTAFTMVQLLAELLVGAALFTSAGDLFAKHSPTKLIPNPDYVEAVELLEKMKQEAVPASEALIKKTARLALLEHGLTLHLSEQMATYERLRAQLLD